jgi:hypothetical protein
VDTDASYLKKKLGLTDSEAEGLAKMRQNRKVQLASKIIHFIKNAGEYYRSAGEKLIADCGDDYEPVKALLQDSLKSCKPEPLEQVA